MQIMALACETPASADRPVSTWTPRELADEAVKLGIVEQISPRTVERWRNQSAYHGKTWVDIDKQGQLSKWVTLRACSVLKAVYG